MAVMLRFGFTWINVVLMSMLVKKARLPLIISNFVLQMVLTWYFYKDVLPKIVLYYSLITIFTLLIMANIILMFTNATKMVVESQQMIQRIETRQ